MYIKRFCTYFVGLGAIAGIAFISLELLRLGSSFNHDKVGLLIAILVLIQCTATLYLIISSKLYSLSESDKVEEENKILRMQIEQKKLKEELNSK